MMALFSFVNKIQPLKDSALRLKLSQGAAMPMLALNWANKMATLSYGDTTVREEIRKEIPVLNQIKGKVVRIKNQKTHLEGSVQAETPDIETEELTATAPKTTTTQTVTHSGTTISFNPLQVITSGPLGLLPGIAHQEGSGTTTERTPSQVQILADDVVLKVGNLAFSGAQLVAKTVKAIIDGTMTLESLQNEVISSEKKSAWSTHLNALGAGIGGVLQGPTTGLAGFLHRMNHTPFGMIPTIRQEDQQHVERILHEMAQFVGTEEFTLKVGQSLINRSAEVGLRVDGIVKDSGIDAKRVLNQPLQDVHIHKRDAVVVPLADTLALFGALNELTVLRRQAFDAMKEQGLSDREAVKVLNDPAVKKQLETMAGRKEKLMQESADLQERFEKAKAEAAQPIQQSEDILDDNDPRSLQYQIVL